MWKHEDPDEDPRWLSAHFILFGVLNALCILLNVGLTIAALVR